MFAVRYWANRFFGARYWPPIGAAPAIIAECYWVGNGSKTSWNYIGNWNTVAGGSYPGNSSVLPSITRPAIFAGDGNGDCILDVGDVECLRLSVEAGYSGNFDGGIYNVNIRTDVSLASTGMWDMGSGTWTCLGSWDHSGQASFVRGTAAVNMTGTSKTLT